MSRQQLTRGLLVLFALFFFRLASALPEVKRQDFTHSIPKKDPTLKLTLGLQSRVLWTRQLAAPILFTPQLLDQTPVVATSDSELVRFSGSGEIQWSSHLSSSAAAAPLISNGNVLVFTRGGVLLRIGPDGKLVERIQIWQSGSDSRAWLEQLSDGSTLLVQGRSLLHLDPWGRLRTQTRVQGEVVALATSKGHTTTVDTSGRVQRWDHEQQAEHLGSVAHARATSIGGVVIYTSGVEGIRSWNMETQRYFPTQTPPGAKLIGKLAIAGAERPTLWSRARGNLLVRVHLGQAELIPLGAPARRPTPSIKPLPYGKNNVAFVSDSGHLGFWVDGKRHRSQARCSSPVGVVIEGANVVYACSSGTVHALLLSEANAAAIQTREAL